MFLSPFFYFPFSVAMTPLQTPDPAVTSCSWCVHMGDFSCFQLLLSLMLFLLPPYSAEASDNPHSPEEGSIIHLLSLHSGLSPMLATTRLGLWSVDIYFLWIEGMWLKLLQTPINCSSKTLSLTKVIRSFFGWKTLKCYGQVVIPRKEWNPLLLSQNRASC